MKFIIQNEILAMNVNIDEMLTEFVGRGLEVQVEVAHHADSRV
jgi:hypothetical protein